MTLSAKGACKRCQAYRRPGIQTIPPTCLLHGLLQQAIGRPAIVSRAHARRNRRHAIPTRHKAIVARHRATGSHHQAIPTRRGAIPTTLATIPERVRANTVRDQTTPTSHGAKRTRCRALGNWFCASAGSRYAEPTGRGALAHGRRVSAH